MIEGPVRYGTRKKNGVHECLIRLLIVSVSSRSSIKRFTLDRRPVTIIVKDA